MPTLKAPPIEFDFGKEWLQLAREVAEATGKPVLNPSELLNVDRKWIANLGRYNRRYAYERDRLKVASELP